MERKDHNQNDNKPISLMEHIRLAEKAANEEKVDIVKALSRPWSPPNTNKIYCGVEVAEKLHVLFDN